MKKITSIAAALFMATAFCGVCAGCASEISANSESKNDTPPVASVTADAQHKVILCPGSYYSGSTVKPNAVGTGATKLGAADEEAYFVTNAYFATVAAGADLPAATTTRAKTTFQGWTYAKDGVVETVEKMPASLDGNLYLYASWKTTGSIPVDPGTDPDPNPDPTPSVASVNGKAMTKNTTPMAGVDEEYMITDATFTTGETLAFTVNGSAVTVTSLDSASTGLRFASGAVTVANGGTFDLYLKKKGASWELYGSRKISQDEVNIHGEDATAGNVYLAGNITGADFNWSNWNDSMNVHKGLKATKSGSSYTLTVRLTQGDNCKFVKYNSATSSVWQKSLSGEGATYITYNGGSMDNMVIKATGSYTFTVTESNGGLTVSVTYSA